MGLYLVIYYTQVHFASRATTPFQVTFHNNANNLALAFPADNWPNLLDFDIYKYFNIQKKPELGW